MNINTHGDRYIPIRTLSPTNFDLPKPLKDPYAAQVRQALFPNLKPQDPILQLRNPKKRKHDEQSPVGKYDKYWNTQPQYSFRTLDAPEASGDIHRRLIDSSEKSFLAIALDDTCYLYDLETQNSWEFSTYGDAEIASLRWDPSGEFLTIARRLDSGTKDVMEIWDVAHEKIAMSHEIPIPMNQVSPLPPPTLDWEGADLLSVGHSPKIFSIDTRQKQANHVHTTDATLYHLLWSPNREKLAAGCDKIISLFESRMPNAVQQYNHKGVVNALQWSPKPSANVFIAGGKTGLTEYSSTKNTTPTWRMKTLDEVNDITWPDSRCLITAHGGRDGGSIKIWDTKKRELMKSLEEGPTSVQGLEHLGKRREFYSISPNKLLLFWRFPFNESKQMRTKQPRASNNNLVSHQIR